MEDKDSKSRVSKTSTAKRLQMKLMLDFASKE